MGKNEYIVGEFQQTGSNEIDIDLVCKKWNKLWLISQWEEDEYRLVKMYRSNSEKTDLKTTISKETAQILISRLELVQEQSPVFRSGSSWRRLIYG